MDATGMNREQRLEENRRKQAEAIKRKLQQEHNRKVAEVLTWWAEKAAEKAREVA